MSAIVVETSDKALAQKSIVVGGAVMLVTPQIDENYWLLRVRLSETQAVVAFPKFGTIGIGFAREEDWNTNLPYTSTAEQIYEHIKHNKCDASIRKPRVIAAIRALQARIAELKP